MSEGQNISSLILLSLVAPDDRYLLREDLFLPLSELPLSERVTGQTSTLLEGSSPIDFVSTSLLSLSARWTIRRSQLDIGSRLTGVPLRRDSLAIDSASLVSVCSLRWRYPPQSKRTLRVDMSS